MHGDRVDDRRKVRRHGLEQRGADEVRRQFVSRFLVADQNDATAARGDFLHVGHRLFEPGILGRDDDDGHVLVDQRDRAVFQFAGRVALGVDVGNLLELQRAFERQRERAAAPEVESALRIGEPVRDLFDLAFLLQRIRDEARHGDQFVDQARLVLGAQHAARAPERDGETGEHGQLAGEGLGGGDADFGTRQRRRDQFAFARDGRGRHVDDRKNVLAFALGIAQRGQRVRRLAGLRDDDGEPVALHRRFAIAEFGGDIDVHGQARETLEPVTRDQPRVIGGAASGQRHAVQRLGVERQFEGQRDLAAGHVEVMGERAADDLGLLVDFLRHEMTVLALVDQKGGGLRTNACALDERAGGVMKFGAAAMKHDPVAFVEIGDVLGEGRERQRIGAEIHLALAPADGKRRAAARADQEIVLALEQEGQRKGAAQFRQGGGHGVDS